MSSAPLMTGIVLFQRFTGLDAIGPHEVLARCMGRCLFVAASLDPVASHHGLRVLPDATFGACPPLDLLIVPGGPGQTPAMQDEALITFIREKSRGARYVAGVCTGTLLLAKAGLLTGRRATTHWLAQKELARLGAKATEERVVWDGNIITGAGVTSGIDLALTLVERVLGLAEAQRVQLAIEYDPMPPFDAGSPQKAPRGLVEELKCGSRFKQD